ncbi:hypothetical protein Tco_1240666 [Tanacetum coccineum]
MSPLYLGFTTRHNRGALSWCCCARTELITPDLICPSTYQLLRNSGGDSRPDLSFDKSASLERLFSLTHVSLAEASLSQIYPSDVPGETIPYQFPYPKVIPRALGWSKNSIFKRSDCCYLFAKESRTTTNIRPTIAEYNSSWWIRSHKSCKRAHSSFRVSSSICMTDISSNKKWLKDEVISKLNVRVFKLEAIIQVLARERNKEYGTKESDAFGIGKEHYRGAMRFRVKEAKRMRLEEDKLLEIVELNKKMP